MRVVLASASPRRAQILSNAGIRFEVLAGRIEESRRPGETVSTMVRRLAQEKAHAAAAQLTSAPENLLIIGADTVVELEGDILGKPGSTDAAAAMLERLSAKTHRVVTGIALLRLPGAKTRSEEEITSVQFATLSTEEIRNYVTTGEPLDKAGGYAIQGLASRFVPRIDGCYFNVVGLPLARVYRMLIEFGWHPEW